MIRFYTLLLLILPYYLFAQAEISYIQPDIGAPGMNIYMEIIGPTGDKGNFGGDGMYIDGSEVNGSTSDEVRIILSNMEDTSKVTFGPLIVSWDGRMISTQVFIHPDVEPNTWDWENLDNEFKIELAVQVNGSMSIEAETFYIVNPFPVGDKSFGTENVLGASELGKRSPRGAMIVDSLILDGKTYIVSTSDCDPNKAGNQGFLPFILLSKGPIRGQVGTRISLDADNYGNTQDAAPGGGGGGGKFVDEITGKNGDNGGNGYTGGGPGGYNRYIDGGNLGGWKDVGVGTGSDGKSLNGVSPGFTPVNSAAESAGGGTGHPFGTGGEGSLTRNDNERVGGYGGGSGFKGDWAGGGGGYRTSGDQLDNVEFYGRAHGNVMVVPIAGGSGGASGNPEAEAFGIPPFPSGNGGGGGGAVQIFAPVIENIELSAQGGQGSGGHEGSNGGSGSGGYVGVFAKAHAGNITLLAENNERGGKKGKNGRSGYGRRRMDVPNTGLVSPDDIITTGFRGHTSDTTYYVNREDTITGTKEPGKTVDIYLKPVGGSWSKIGTHSSGDTTWSRELSLMDANMYFLTVVQGIPGDNDGDYDDEPDFVLSQASANILKVLLPPEIAGETSIDTTIRACRGNTVEMNAWLWNEGEGPLFVEFNNSTFADGNLGFSLVDPLNETTIGETSLGETDWDSLEVKVEFEYNPNQYAQDLNLDFFSDTLYIPNNDDDEDPWKIAFNVSLERYAGESYAAGDMTFNVPLDTLDLGKVCSGLGKSKSFVFQNQASFPYIVAEPSFIDNDQFFGTVSSTDEVDQSDTTLITIGYNDPGNPSGFIYDMVYVSSKECPNLVLDSIPVKAEIVQADLQATGTTVFDTTRVGNISTETATFENTGTSDLLLRNLGNISVNDPYSVVSTVPAPPAVIKPSETIDINLEFFPQDTVDNPQNIQFLSVNMKPSDSTCAFTAEQELQGTAVQSDLQISPLVMEFDTIPHCETPLDTVTILNKGNAKIEITSNAVIEGPDSEDFEITSGKKQIPLVINDFDTGVKYFIMFNPQSPGQKEAEMVVETDDPDNPFIRIKLTGYLAPFNVQSAPDIIDFGNQPIGFDQTITIDLTNNGYYDENISGIEKVDPENYITGISDPTNDLMPANGGTSAFTMTINPVRAGGYSGFVKVKFDQPCEDSLMIPFEVTGIRSTMTIADSINYGVLPPCGDSIDVVKFENSSSAPYVILAERLEDDDSGLFTITSTGAEYPDTLGINGKESFGAQIYFNPDGAAPGVYTATYVASVYINGEVRDTTIYLKGTVAGAEYAVTTDPLDMGDVIIGTGPVTRQLTIENTGQWDIRITGFQIQNPEGIFSINPDPTGDLIPAGGAPLVVDVSFDPQQNIDYEKDISFEFEFSPKNCIDDSLLTLTGSGGLSKKVILRMPDIIADPRNDDLVIPLYAKITTNDEDSDMLSDFTLDSVTIRFDRTLYYPRSLSNGKILDSYVENGDRVVEFSVTADELNRQESILTEFTGYAMLGSVVSTPLSFTSTAYSDNQRVSEIEIDASTGNLTIEVCESGGNRLLQYAEEEPGIYTSPNPAQDDLNVQLQLLEKGTHSLYMTGLNGKRELLHSWNVETESDKLKIINVDTGKLSSGSYYLILRGPNRSYTKPVIISK